MYTALRKQRTRITREKNGGEENAENLQFENAPRSIQR